ncbi:MAG: SOS response-associated peptidase [Pseudomonadota bacterium]
MCGRFAIGIIAGADWAEWLGLNIAEDLPPDWPEPSWNIAPTQPVGIVGRREGRRAASVARWGLVPVWWQKPLSEFRLTTFNARSEEAGQKPVFRDSFAKRRCLIPAIGWYEWQAVGSGDAGYGKKGAKIPHFITMRRNTPGFWFAGLWSQTKIGGEILRSCTILTTAAGEATRHLHPRTPIVLDDETADRWLDLSIDPMPLMVAPPDDRVELWEVDSAVGKVANNGPELMEKVGLNPGG